MRKRLRPDPMQFGQNDPKQIRVTPHHDDGVFIARDDPPSPLFYVALLGLGVFGLLWLGLVAWRLASRAAGLS